MSPGIAYQKSCHSDTARALRLLTAKAETLWATGPYRSLFAVRYAMVLTAWALEKGVCKHGKVRGGEATSVEAVNFPDWKPYVRTKCPELVVY